VAVLLIIGTSAGILLGLRFKTLVLCPAIIVAAIAMAGIGIASGNPIRSIAFDIGLVAVALQTGYAVGCIIRLPLLATVRPRHLSSAPLPLPVTGRPHHPSSAPLEY
jgi:hypothetical protein